MTRKPKLIEGLVYAVLLALLLGLLGLMSQLPDGALRTKVIYQGF
jgi:hypothetical protein